MDLLHRLHILRPPHSTRKRKNQLDPTSPPRPYSALATLPSRVLDENIYAETHLTSRSVQYERPVHTPTPTAGQRGSKPDALATGLHEVVQTPEVGLNDLHGPTFPPSPAPGQTSKSRTPYILRSLAHHPSLSALRKKKNKTRTPSKSCGKASALERLSDGLDEEVAVEGQVIGVGRVAEAIEGGSVRVGGGRLRKKSLKGSRSVPRDLRLSEDSAKFRYTMTPPLPSPTELLRARVSSFGHSAQFPASTREMLAPTHEVEDDSRLAGSPESVRVRMRFELRMATPERRAGPLGTSTGQSPRQLSTPPSPAAYRIIPRSPPRLSLPPTSQHPHPIPLTPSSRQRTMTHLDRSQSEEVDDPDDATSLVAVTRVPVEDEFEGIEDGLSVLVPHEELPIGTPGGSRADLRRGALVDGVRVEKGAIRLFSRDTYGSPVESPPASATSSLAPTPTPFLQATPSPTLQTNGKRSSSPFEVKLSPNVTKRMSLDAFGMPSPGGTHDDREMEELADEDGDLPKEEADEEDTQPRHPLDGFHGTQLEPIEESPDTSYSSRFPFGRSLETPSHLACLDHTKYYTPSSPSKAVDTSTEDASSTSSTDSDSSPPLPRKHASAPPLRISRSPLDANAEHRAALGAQVAAGEIVTLAMKDEIEALREELGEERKRAAKEEEEELAGLTRALQAKDQAMEQMRSALGENGEFFDRLQETHIALATRCGELEQRNSSLVEEAKRDRRCLAESQTKEAGVGMQLKVMKRTNGQLIRELAAAKSEVLELRAGKKEFEEQLEATTEKFMLLVKAQKEESGAEARRRSTLSDLECGWRSNNDDDRAELQPVQGELRRAKDGRSVAEEKLKETDSLLKTRRAEPISTRTSLSVAQVELTAARLALVKKDAAISQLRDKLQTARFAADESMLKVQREIVQLQAEVSERREEEESREQVVSVIVEGKCRLAEELLAAREMVSKLEEKARQDQSQIENPKADIRGRQQEGFACAADLAGAREENEELARLVERQRAEIERMCLVAEDREGCMVDAEEVERRESVWNEALEKERSMWAEEKQELLAMLAGLDQSEATGAAELREQVDNLTDDLKKTEADWQTLYDALEDANDRLETKDSTLALQDEQIDVFRQNLAEAEDLHARTIEAGEMRARDAELALSRLRQEAEQLHAQVASHAEALKAAVTDREMERSRGLDVRSRLAAYLGEIDRLKVVEARLGAQVEELTRRNALDELNRAEMRKRIVQAEEEKELLNVALDSKQTEVVLLQRQLGVGSRAGSVTPRTQRMAQSTRTAPPTPGILSLGGIETPLPRRQTLSSSASANGNAANKAVKADRRESSVVQSSSTPSMARPTLASSTKSVLGASTRHNRTPERARPGSATKAMAGDVSNGAKRPVAPAGPVAGLRRQSSLPVLATRVRLGTEGGGRKVSSVIEEDEAF